jgi:hypothetical protein
VPAGGCSDKATMNGTWKQGPAMGVKFMKPPVSNDSLEVIANNGGNVFYGKTYIHLNGDTMDVSSMVNGVRTLQKGLSLPTNGVIYVDAYVPKSGSGSCTQQYPTAAGYNEEDYCANVYVNGTYNKSLTIGARNDVIVAPTDGTQLTWGQPFGLTKGNNQVVLGLIANNFVRVAHPVNRGSSCTNAYSTYDGANLSIDAAILSIDHSFIVDNYDCGNGLGKLNVTGAIAQRYRGAVGTAAGTGFLKNYWYDDRLKYRSPPHFLNPIDSAWQVVRENEQVPAR